MGRWVDGAARALSAELASSRGVELQRGIATHLVGILGVDVAFVVRCDPMDPSHPRILAWVEDGALRGDVRFPLADTPLTDALHPDEVLVPEGLSTGHPENRFLRRRGLDAWASVPLRDLDGGTMGHLGVLTRGPLQAPEETRTVLRLLGSHLSLELVREAGEQRFLQLLGLVPDAILVADVGGSIALANRQAEALFGWEEGQLPGQAMESVLPQLFGPGGSWVRPLPEGSGGPSRGAPIPDDPSKGDLWGVRRDGRRFPIAVNLSDIPAGQGGGVLVIVRSLEGEREAEAELAATRANFLDAFQSINEGVILWDSAERAAWANHQALEFLPEVSRELATAATFTRVVERLLEQGVLAPPEDIGVEVFIQRVVQRYREADGGEVTLHLPDGRIWAVTTLPSRRGGRVTVVSDITEKARTEENFRRVQKMEALGKLTGGLAHDFNNYLGVIFGYLEMLAETGELDPVARTYVDAAMQAARKGADLTRSLLSFARQQPLSPRTTEVLPVVTETLELLRRTLGEDVRIRLEATPGPHPVRIDREQMGSALVNLANNSRDAMPGGGDLTIRVRNQRLGSDYLAAHPYATAGEYVLLEVADTGGGMSEETRALAFEPFFTTKGPGHGTGLGLSMVYGFVKQSGGYIDIHSRVGEGTAVRIYLPRVAAEAPPLDDSEESREASTPLPRGEETLMVVEDNAQVREAVVLQVESLGYRVLQAEDGEEAERLLESVEEPIDLLFTDVVLPGKLDGKLLSRRARKSRPGMKVLFTSGFAPDILFTDLDLEPGQFLLSKPYRRSELARAIRRALDRPEERGEPA